MASIRRLAAIMFTDTVGYTASTQANEGRTLDLLRQQVELVRPLLAVHQGREVKSTGDGFLVAFDSALKATQCAVSIQRRIHERNMEGGLAPIRIRIGIHLGDVVQSGTDILGDAVNIAARIESIAEPGGISVSGAVHEQIRNKIPEQLEKLAPTALKGLQVPMEIYRIVLPWTVPDTSPASAVPTGLAVLPFSNISPDPKDEYFADGLTEELISVLSQLRDLRVIARTSVMPYKATSKGVSQIGAELGVSSVLEGSVRKAGNHLRITAQLIDVASQGHVWSNSYDRELDDVFALQSEMAKQVAEALKVKLLSRDKARLDQRSPPSPESYLEYLQGRTSLHGFTETEMRAAQDHFEHAIALDDRNAAAHAGLADLHRLLGGMYHHIPDSEWEALSRQHASRAVELDPNLAEAHASLGMILWDDYDFAAAEKELKFAIALNPSFAGARMWYANLLSDELRTEEALREQALAEQLDPLSALLRYSRVQLLIYLRRLDEADDQIEKLGRAENFGFLYHGCRFSLALAHGDMEEARKEIDRLGELLPGRPEIVAASAVYYAMIGEGARARELLRSIEGLPESVRPDTQIAGVYARLGDLDATFRWLELSVQARKMGIQFWRLEPKVAHVRSDPRFQVLLKRINLV
ncbi:MAG: adenylate/guanylate cyclase domain-containing protein [Thermoplasmata archaeon]